MAKPKRYLVLTELANSGLEGFARQQQEAFAACPEAARYSDEEAEDFLLAAFTYDYLVKANQNDPGLPLRRLGITYPQELASDAYRLGRYIFRRWNDLAFRDLLFSRVLGKPPRHATVPKRRQIKSAMETAESLQVTIVVAALRRTGDGDMIPQVKAEWTPAEQAEHEALLLFSKVRMHQFTSEPEPPRTPTRWEQQKLLRRLHLREVQVCSLGRSLHHLRRERKALISRLRMLNSEMPELRRLAEELEAVQAEEQADERRHAAALAAQKDRYEAEIAALQTQLQRVRSGYAQALALRDCLLTRTGR